MLLSPQFSVLNTPKALYLCLLGVSWAIQAPILVGFGPRFPGSSKKASRASSLSGPQYPGGRSFPSSFIPPGPRTPRLKRS